MLPAPAYKRLISAVSPLIAALLMGINPIDTVVFMQFTNYILNLTNPNHQGLTKRSCLLPKVD